MRILRTAESQSLSSFRTLYQATVVYVFQILKLGMILKFWFNNGHVYAFGTNLSSYNQGFSQQKGVT